MITRQDLNDLFILWLSGAAKMKNEKEIVWHTNITVEFIDFTLTKSIIREYCRNGNKHRERNLINGKLEGVSKRWYKSGQIFEQEEYKNGERNGISKRFGADGSILWEGFFENGIVVETIYPRTHSNKQRRQK